MSNMTKREDLDDPRTTAMSQMNEDLQTEFESIRAEIEEQAHKNVLFYYKLGGRIRRIHANQQKYGEGAVDKMAGALDMDRGTLYKAMTFTDQYTKAQIDDYLNRGKEAGQVITWSHFSQLVAIPDEAQRKELIEQVLTNGLSVRDLKDEIAKRLGAGGLIERQITPRSILGGLSQVSTMSNKLLDKVGKAFDKSIVKPAANLRDEDVTQEMLDRVQASRTALLNVAKESGQKADKLDELANQLQKALARQDQKKAAEQKAADKKEEADKAKKASAKSSGNSKASKKKKARRPVTA